MTVGQNIQGRHAELLRKVPEITLIFWVIKLLTTAMGEVTSDFLVHQMDSIIAVFLGAVGLSIALLLQLFVRKYIPWIYWLAVVMVAIFGTMAADILHIGLGIPYLISSLFFSIILAVVFLVWYKSEKTLSIHSITTHRREFFYWATVMATFALGTSFGDMTATTLHLGYFISGIVFAALFTLPAILYWKFQLNAVVAFWIAYILTRPFGGSCADWIARSQMLGGLGVGTGIVSWALTLLIVLGVGYITIPHNVSYSFKYHRNFIENL